MKQRFTEKYLDYAREFTDCPDLFLKWGAYLALSSQLSRNTLIRIGSWNIVPNLWVILVGKSSSHKSTALRITEDLCERANGDRLCANEFSQEFIIKSLSENSERLFLFDEAKSFFDLIAKHYNEGLKSLFTTLYRKPNYSRTTIKHGTLEIHNAYLCMGMATTPEWLTQSVKEADQEMLSGFLARFLIIPSKLVPVNPIPLPPPHDKDKFISLLECLKKTTEHCTEYVYHSSALKSFYSWYESMSAQQQKAGVLIGPFYEHLKNEAIHKLSILAAIDRSEHEITDSAFQEAVEMVACVEGPLGDTMETLFDEKWDRERKRVVDYLREKMICKREDLADATYLHGERLSRILHGLEEDNQIRQEKKKATTRMITLIEWLGGTL